MQYRQDVCNMLLFLFNYVLWRHECIINAMPPWHCPCCDRAPTLSTRRRPTRNCSTTRRSCWTMETAGNQRLLLICRLTISTDEPLHYAADVTEHSTCRRRLCSFSVGVLTWNQQISGILGVSILVGFVSDWNPM